MRTRINIDSATPEEIKNLTRALQTVTALDTFDGENPNPSVWVDEDGDMGWESPSIPRQRAAAMLKEFDRLESGLFDRAAKMPMPCPDYEDRPDTGTFEEMDERDGKPSPEPLTVGTEVYYRGEPGWVVTGQPSDEHGMAVIANDKRNRTVPISALEEVEQPSPEPEGGTISERANEVEAKGFLLGAHVWHKGDEYEVRAIWGDEDETVNISKVGGDPSRQRRVPINVLELVEPEADPSKE